MATYVSHFFIFIPFLPLLHVTFINGLGRQVDQENGNTCYFYSGIWKGGCFISEHCETQCKEKEGALGGHCDDGFACQCKYNCNEFCETLSGTWRGPCFSDSICSIQCRERDGKFRGHCPDYRCWCVFYCNS